MMVAVALTLMGFGCVAVMTRRSFLGVVVGLQLLSYSLAWMFVSAGKAVEKGHVIAMLVLLSGLAQLACGLAIAARVFLIKKTSSMRGLEELKR